MFLAQLVGIGKSQAGIAAETEDIADSVEPFVGHLFPNERIQLLLGQRHFDIGFVDLHLVVLKRILFDPLVSDSIEDEVFQTTQQVDCSVVLTVVGRLHKGIQSVDIFVRNHIQRQVVFLVLLFGIFRHIPQQTVILVGRKLGNTYSDFFLPFVAVFRKLRKKHVSVAASIFQLLFDGKTVRLPTLLDDVVVGRKDIGSIGGYDLVDLQGNGIPEHRSLQPLVPMLRLDLALRVDFGNAA